MGDSRRSWAAAEADVWLRDGGRVVAASERAARAVAEGFHRARQAEGLSAWVAPQVETWNEFVRNAWEAACPSDDRLVMNPVQEQALWTQVIEGSPQRGNLLAAPLRRMAKMAADGHALLCAYAPEFLKEAARGNWQQDAAAFSGWLSDFDRRCASGRLVSAARLPLELYSLLQETDAERQALLLVGFDRVQPTQDLVLKKWGVWQQCAPGEVAELANFYEAPDEQLELKACSLWCKEKLSKDENARLMVVTQDLPARRGEFERAFQQYAGDGARVEFSLGVPLGQTPLVCAAYLLLQWLAGSVEEHELDWLLGCGQLAGSAAETDGLTGFMRALRRRGMERTHWRCDEFMRQGTAGAQLPAEWVARISDAQRRLDGVARKSQSPMAWAEFVPELLRSAGWPGKTSLTSEEYQALRRWEHVLDTCASLGFDGRRMMWNEFLEAVNETLRETLFAPESQDASVLITGPAESAGLAADAIWFMGATEEAWPAKGSLHPLLPFWVQRDARIPHATAQVDWDQARTVTARLRGSAQEVCFSSARQVGGVEMRASKLGVQHAGEPQPLPERLAAVALPPPALESVEDLSRVPLAVARAEGGSAVLSAQSQCPFKAFASTRLGAEGWKPAEAGLNAMQRGNLLHEVLHAVWGPGGIRSLAELQALVGAELRTFVNARVRTVLASEMPAGVRERMPAAYLALEEERLTNIVSEWLEFERTRAEFTVAGIEVEKDITVAGLSLKLRLDRIDRLNDGSFLVIDYKTGTVSTKAWEMPRPEDVQLPLYAGFALDRKTERLGGLVFAKLKKGEGGFAGKVADAKNALLPGLGAGTSLVKKPLTLEELEDWREYIEKMARDFLVGRADVDPIDSGKTCERCGLQILCRIDAGVVGEEGESDEEEDDE